LVGYSADLTAVLSADLTAAVMVGTSADLTADRLVHPKAALKVAK
jgi:hypothetical protein